MICSERGAKNKDYRNWGFNGLNLLGIKWGPFGR